MLTDRKITVFFDLPAAHDELLRDRPAVAKVKSLAIRKLLLKIEPGLDLPTVRKYLALAQQQMLQDKRYASLQIYFDVDPL